MSVKYMTGRHKPTLLAGRRLQKEMWKVRILRVFQWIVRVIDQIVITLFGYSVVSGWKMDYVKAKSNYESSAHILKIGFRAKIGENEPGKLENFLLFHSAYVHPCYVCRDDITLFGVTADQAFFAVLPSDIDVYSSELHPFMYVSQFRFATHIIVMPMESFHLLSDEIGDPRAQIVLVSNTGRCGSTLLAQMFENIPKTVMMSEPDAFHLAYLEHRAGRTSDEQDSKILRSIVRLQCKIINGRQIDRIIMKTRAMCVQQIKKINKQCKYIQHVFMYRHPKNTICSFASGFQWMPPDLLKAIFGDTFPLPETERYQCIKSSNMAEGLSLIGFIALLWVTCCVCYIEYKHEGIEIYPLRYEDLLKDPRGTASKLFSFLDLSKEFVSQALKALQKDSQRGSALGQHMLTKHRIHELTAEQQKEVNYVLLRSGFPSVEEFQDLPNWTELVSPLQLNAAYTRV